MKNRSTIQTLTFVQTNPDHLNMKLNMPDFDILGSSCDKLFSCEINNAAYIKDTNRGKY